MPDTALIAIGDVQGCLESLEGLIEQFPDDARLIFVGTSSTADPIRWERSGS